MECISRSDRWGVNISQLTNGWGTSFDRLMGLPKVPKSDVANSEEFVPKNVNPPKTVLNSVQSKPMGL